MSSGGILGFLSGLVSTVSGTSVDLGEMLDPYLHPYAETRRQRAEDMQYNAEQSQIQRDWESMMFDRANQWNSESAQVARMRAAGLNPSLMMSGGLSGATATVPSGAEAQYSGAVGAGNPMALLQTLSQVKLNDAQAENLQSKTISNYGNLAVSGVAILSTLQDIVKSQSEIELNRERISNLSAMTAGVLLDNSLKEIDKTFSEFTFNQRLEQFQATTTERAIAAEFARKVAEAQIRNWDADTRAKNASAFIDEISAKYQDELSQAQITAMFAAANLAFEQGKTVEDYRNFFDAHKEEDRLLSIIFQGISAGNQSVQSAMDVWQMFSPKPKPSGWNNVSVGR